MRSSVQRSEFSAKYMEQNSRNEVGSSDDNESKSLLQEVGVVHSETPEQSYDIANEGGEVETSLSYQDKPSTISTRQDYILSGEHLLKQHPEEDAILVGEKLEIAERTEKPDGPINNEQESFPGEGSIKDDMSINGDCFQQANSEGFQEMPFHDDEVSSHIFIDAELPTERRSEAAGFVSEKTYLLRTEDNPKDKALRYLEESGVIRLFQNLAAGIVHDRPEKPLVYMIKTLERAHDGDWEKS